MIKSIIHNSVALFKQETYTLAIPLQSTAQFAFFYVSVSQPLLAETFSLIKFK